MSTLLSQGGYGCVYYPGISCDGKIDKDNKKIVTKLQIDEEWTRREIEIGEKITNINNFLSFFSPVIESCPVNISKIDKKILGECEVIKPEKGFDYILMSIPFIDRDKFLYVLIKNFNRSLLLHLLETNKFILTAIKLLINNKLIHFDLKAENIIFKKQDKKPIIVDFGISLDKSKLMPGTWDAFFYGYHPEYPIWPLEVHLINYLMHVDSELTQENIETVCNDVIFNNIRFNNVLSINFLNNYYSGAVKYYQQFIGKSKNEIIKSLIDKSWYTWDLYSLAVLNIHIFSYIFSNGYFKNKLMIFFHQIILKSLHYDLTQRPEVNEVIAMFNAIYSTIDNIDEYNDLKNILDKNIKQIDIESI